MGTCPSCGGEVSERALYCSHCSAEQPPRSAAPSAPVVTRPRATEPPPVPEEFVPLRKPSVPEEPVASSVPVSPLIDPDVMDPEMIRAMTFDRSSPSPARSRRGTQLALIGIAAVAFLGIGGLALMMGSLKDPTSSQYTDPLSPERPTAPPGAAATPDEEAKATLERSAAIAEATYATSLSFAGIGGTLATISSFQSTDGPSAGPNSVSFVGTPITFTAAALGSPGTCWYIRVSKDPATAGTHTNSATGVSSCSGSAVPKDGWTDAQASPTPSLATSPEPGAPQLPVEPSPPLPR